MSCHGLDGAWALQAVCRTSCLNKLGSGGGRAVRAWRPCAQSACRAVAAAPPRPAGARRSGAVPGSSQPWAAPPAPLPRRPALRAPRAPGASTSTVSTTPCGTRGWAQTAAERSATASGAMRQARVRAGTPLMSAQPPARTSASSNAAVARRGRACALTQTPPCTAVRTVSQGLASAAAAAASACSAAPARVSAAGSASASATSDGPHSPAASAAAAAAAASSGSATSHPSPRSTRGPASPAPSCSGSPIGARPRLPAGWHREASEPRRDCCTH